MPITLPYSNFVAGDRIYAAQLMVNFALLARSFASYTASSWTPALSFGNASSGMTYGTQSGAYIKVGRFVWYVGTITLTAKGASTGTARITGFPYTTTEEGSAFISTFTNGASLGDVVRGFIQCPPTVSATALTLVQVTGTTTSTVLTEANFTDTSSLTVIGVLTTQDT